MRYLILCLLSIGCVSGRSPSVDVDASLSSGKPSLTESVGNVIAAPFQGVIKNNIDYAVEKHQKPLVKDVGQALVDWADGKQSHAAPAETAGNAVTPVAAPVEINPRLRVLFFTGNECAPCLKAKQTLESMGIKLSLSHAADYVEVNIDEARNADLKAWYKPRVVPTFYIVDAKGYAYWMAENLESAASVPSKLAELRNKSEQVSVLLNKPAAATKQITAACTCNPCLCPNCQCGMQAAQPAMLSGGCGSCGVRGRRR
jgi:glutaredoxin